MVSTTVTHRRPSQPLRELRVPSAASPELEAWRCRSLRRVRGVVAAAVLVAGSGTSVAIAAPAKGAPGVVESFDEVERVTLEFQKAEGLGAYVALRRLWGLWESENPRKVEEALLLAATSPKHSPDVTTYARVLAAYARVRRGDFETAKRTFRELGFVSDFLVLGPFDNEGKAGLDRVEQPEGELAEPLVPGRAYTGKERAVRYRRTPDVFPYGWVDLGAMLRPSTHICAFSTTFVRGGSAERNITVWVGASGAYRLHVNGEQVLEEKAYRGLDVGRTAATVRLLPGENRFTLKVCGSERSPLFSLRLADAAGRPDPSLVAHADFEASEKALENVERTRKKSGKLPHPTRLTAPVERAVGVLAAKSPKAAELEVAARYLRETAGDDPTKHEARDLATRAVEVEPTIERHLLVAELSEDRNQMRREIEKAEVLAKGRPPGDPALVELLLAKAWLARSGPSPREAFPLYEEVLERDPENLTALQGRIELYNAAGLRQSALETLEEAWSRRPHSVLLSSMVASQRKALGLTSQAFEAEQRYSMLRFDDSSLLADRLELALKRRNRPATQHFVERLLATDPDGLWGFHTAASVHRRLGEEERALFDLERGRQLAPEDIGLLRALADLKGRRGARDEQLSLLGEILRIRPQEVDVRKYADHIKPKAESPDEKYAMAATEFLKERHAPSEGHPRRTLRDLTVSTVYENGLSSQFRQVVFQPLTDASAALSRQYAFHYEADRQVVELKGARVYRADGSIDEAIESGEGAANDPSISMYTSGRTFYVQFPRLEPGDVVEARYRIDDVTPRNEFADYYGDVVYFQSDEPTKNVEYVLLTPKSRKILVDTQVSGVTRTETETEHERIYRFFAKAVAPVTPEPAMPPWSEVLGYIHVSTYPTWEALGGWYWGLVRDQFDLDPETKKLAREIAKDAKTDEEKVKAVYGWVVKNTRYVALEFGIYGYKPHRCVQTVSRGWGDCKDKATVIVTLLKELGIPANLVILRTQMRGDFTSKLPSLAPFDHAIAYVPSLDLYLDGTAEYVGSTELPSMDQGALGLLIGEGTAKPVRLPIAEPSASLVHREVQVQLERGGAAKRLGLRYEVRGHSAAGYRARYEAEGTRRERVTSDLAGEFPGLVLDKSGIRTSDLGDLERPVFLEVAGKSSQFARQEGERLSVPVTLGVRLTPEYASLSSRKQDVVILGFSGRRERVVVDVPAGLRVESLPPSAQAKSRFGEYSVSAKVEGNTVVVESFVSLSVTRVAPSDYPEFRKFCLEADQAQNHRLVLAP